MVQPVSREGHILITVKETNSIFLIGGKNYEFLSDIFELKIDTLQWTRVTLKGEPLPGLSDFAFYQDKSRVFIYGGQMAGGKDYGNVLLLDLKQRTSQLILSFEQPLV